MRVRNLVRWIVIAIVVLFVLLYGFSKTRDLIFGTKITIDTPRDGQSFSDPLVNLSGHVGQVTRLLLNGKLILPNEKGEFKENYLLIAGLNRVTVSAIDRFDRTTSKTLMLYYKPDETALPVIIVPVATSTPTEGRATSTETGSATSTATSSDTGN